MKNKLILLLVIGMISCADNEQYKVQFDEVDWLRTGDRVAIKGLDVGQVRALKLDSDKKIIVTLEIYQKIKLPKGSTFTIHSDLFGQKHIEINLSDAKELMDPNEIQKGYIQPRDTTGFKKLTPEQLDSLVKHDPVYRLADTVMQILRSKKKEKDSIKK